MRAPEEFLDRFEEVRAIRTDRWQAACPAHNDRTPSLSIMHKPNGDWLLHCHAGCAVEDIVEAIKLEKRDLFAETANGHREIVATYDYTDETGELLFQVLRFAPKDFRQRRPDGIGGWEWNLNGTRRVLYRLPRVLEAVKKGEDILIPEGERDVEALERLGIAATCNPGGAGKWRDEYSEMLRGAHVTVVADRDDPGREHARQVAESLNGVANEVNVVECTKGKDTSDHLAAGGTIAGLIELQILSATRESAVAESISGLPFTLAGDVIANAPPDPDWIWNGYVAPGEVSLIAGRPKVGKSTLVFGLIAAISTAGHSWGAARAAAGCCS